MCIRDRFRSSSALDSLAQADAFVFDKTGTLTSGLLDVTDGLSLDAEWDDVRLLALVASIEEHASHPVADAAGAADMGLSRQPAL